MKKFLVFAASLFCLCSCVYDIDWAYDGYAEIQNKTSQTLTITISGSLLHCSPLDGIIKSEESFIQYYLYPDSESLKTGNIPAIITIALDDGSEIVCTSSSDASWSKRFFDSCETRNKALWYRFQKHVVVVETYFIDDELISLWRRDH